MIDGILNIYKEKGFTSHDVVAKLRGIVKQKKIGHTGTLDPEAEGVLPVCLGKATKVCDLLTDRDKTYEAVLLLGRTTDTQDTTGSILEEKETAHLTEKEVRGAIYSFEGEYDQVPPMYSALKVNGRKLYELARAGQEVERKPRRVQILKIEILSMDLPSVNIRVSCSKGTYIRTLCQDIGDQLGCGGCMDRLLRVQAGPFSLKDSLKLSEVEQIMADGRIEDYLIAPDMMFQQFPAVHLPEEAQKRIENGNPLEEELVKPEVCSPCDGGQVPDSPELCRNDGQQVRVYTASGKFAAVYQYEKEKHRYRPVKMFL